MYIELKNINKSYGDFQASKDVSFEIEKGKLVGLLGPSGSGKTTILRLINGLIPDYFDGELEGEVLYNEKNISDMEMYERARFAGSVFQNPRTQFFNVDTDSEIAFGMENMGISRTIMQQRMLEVTDKLRLQKLRERSIFELSGGEKQRIAFASVYAMHPDVYLLDEPSSNLDTRSVDELKEQLKVMKEDGKTILISEHRIYYLMDLADRILYLDKGEIQAEFTREEFLALSDEKRVAMGLRTIRKKEIEIPQNPNGFAVSHGLTLSNISISRGKKILQKDITFSVDKGDILGIIGENGAGKSTLLRTICGLHRNYEGQILLEGKPLTNKKRILYSYMVMQDVNYELFADSVENECRLGMKNADDTAICKTLQALSLYQFRRRHPNTLSGGQKQRVAVAVSQICGKKILVFDEPTSGLDYDSMMQVAQMIRMLAQNAIVIIVTHDVEFINNVCTKIYELRKERQCEREEDESDRITAEMGRKG